MFSSAPGHRITSLSATRLLLVGFLTFTVFAVCGCDGFSSLGSRHATPADLPARSVADLARGDDADGNGVRDQVDEVLIGLFPDATERKPWAMYAKALQSGAELQSAMPTAEINKRGQALRDAQTCIASLPLNIEIKTKAMNSLWLVTFDSLLRRDGAALLVLASQFPSIERLGVACQQGA